MERIFITQTAFPLALAIPPCLTPVFCNPRAALKIVSNNGSSRFIQEGLRRECSSESHRLWLPPTICVFTSLGDCRHDPHMQQTQVSYKFSFLTEPKPMCQSAEGISAHLHKSKITELHGLSHGLSLKVCCISRKSLRGTELTSTEGRILCKD